MVRKKQAEGDQAQPPPAENGPPDANGVQPPATPPAEAGGPEKKLPTYKVGPILTDAQSAVGCEVWESHAQLSDGRSVTVHQITLQASFRDSAGTWKPSRTYRGSQLYVLLYCLQKASDFILSRRDPQNDCPF